MNKASAVLFFCSLVVVLFRVLALSLAALSLAALAAATCIRLDVLFLRGGGYLVRDRARGEEEGPEAAQREHRDDGEL